MAESFRGWAGAVWRGSSGGSKSAKSTLASDCSTCSWRPFCHQSVQETIPIKNTVGGVGILLDFENHRLPRLPRQRGLRPLVQEHGVAGLDVEVRWKKHSATIWRGELAFKVG